MKIVKLFEPTSTDGYHDRGAKVYFKTFEEAQSWSFSRWKGYSSRPIVHFAIMLNEGMYYILKQEAPVHLWSEELELEQKKKVAIDKLTEEEQILLGLK